jgi:hypothetical protein
VTRAIRLHHLLLLPILAATAACSLYHGDPGRPGGWEPDANSLPDAPTCVAPAPASVEVHLAGPTLGPIGCDPAPTSTPPQPVHTTVGAVVATHDDATGSHLTLDLCKPGGGCAPTRDEVTVVAEGFSFASHPALQAGQFVSLRTQIDPFWGCHIQLELTNLPAWNGHPNPIRGDAALLAVAAVGEYQSLPAAPVAVDRQEIGCKTAGSDCGEPAQVFALSFRDPRPAGAPPTLVHQGDHGTFGFEGRTYALYDARSFNSGGCDQYWDYDWTLREVAP